MEENLEKYKENILLAVKTMKIGDHIAYVTYPVIKDKRLLMKSLDSAYDSIVAIINSSLQYDYMWKRIQLQKDPKANFDTFMNKCSPRLDITPEENMQILELFSIVESHRKSPIEFMRKDKVVILSPSLQTNVIDLERVKRYLNLSKKMIEKARKYMNLF